MSTPAAKFQYQVGGSLEKQAPCYVTRQADEDFYQALKAGEFCYVLNSRQMGKSSLRVRVMQRLQAEGVACATIDITSIGSQGITAAEWYLGIVRRLVRGFRVPVDALEWWNGREGLSPVQRLSEFLEEELLVAVTQPIAIFIDEIDSILKLDFKDDFFALIRACYNQRAERSDYQRLTFALLGVATPSDLIQDKNRTPFNIGRAIAVEGFQLQEAQPLVPGLAGKAERPEAVLQAILDWTGGQPFLTQKLCQLVAKSPVPIAPGEEAAAIAQCVQSSILDQWEAQDDPEHLKTIRDRVLNNEQQQGQVLGLYQTVLRQGSIPADTSAEQIQLRLSGLVVERQGQLTVYNPIYGLVFNQAWTEAILAQLRPYAAAFTAWEAAGRQDESRLLRGNTLQEGEAWAQGKSLGEADWQFLQASEKAESRAKQEAMAEANEILDKAKRQATRRLAIASILLGVAVPIAAISGWQSIQAKQQAMAATEKAKTAEDRGTAAEVRATAAVSREQQATTNLKQTQGQMAALKQQETTARQQAAVATQAVATAQQELTTAKQQATEKTNQVAAANQALATVKQQVADQTALVKAAETKVATAVQQQQSATQKVTAAETKLSQVQIELNRREAEFRDIWSFSQGQSQLSQGKPEEAQKIFDQILKRNPHNSFVRISLSSFYADQKDYARAINELQSVLKIDSKNAFAWNGLGNILSDQNKLNEAIAAYQKAIEIDPNYGYAYSNLGNALKAQNKLEDAISAYRQAIALDPKYATAYYNLGIALSDQNKLDDAITAYRQAIALDPKLAQAYYNLGTALSDQKQLDDAIAAYRQAIALDPKSATAYYNLGIALSAQKQLDDAIAAYRQAIALDPKSAYAYNGLGAALSDQNKLDDAITAYRQAIALDPKFAPAYNNLGNALSAQKQLDDAITAYRQAIALDPKYATAYNGLGVALSDQKQLDDAIAAYRQAISLDPKSALVHANLGEAYDKAGRPQDALNSLDQALQHNPNLQWAVELRNQIRQRLKS